LKDGEFRVEAEAALEMARRLVREEGLFVGFSAGAAVHAALELARTLDRGVVVTVLPDGGAKYISLGLFD
ncbi:MAG: cysteine synthase, partial [Caldilineales bacterium]|nr:cysteine synthase [Caldilineales bacterium]